MATPIDAIVGTSVEVQSVKTLISRVANSDVTVLIAGEPGTGKTLAAMTIHQMSRRAGESLLQFDCAATSEEFLESELFGSEGSGGVKRGLLETTNGRTILLQNIDQIPPRTQTRLLRVLQDREFQRIGGTEILPTDCRFIGTCSGDMRQMVQANLFREDLYYRLNVIFIHLPPLRERPKDIKPLLCALLTRRGVDTEQFMEKLQRQKLIEYFEKYAWPGNVKELNRVVEMAVLAERWDEIKLHLLGHTAHSNKLVIERTIEFPPEYHQAGISILGFFGEVLRRKYPHMQARVRIEQDGLRVKMTVEPVIGEPAVFEQALNEYGLVLTGQIPPEQFTQDSLLAMSLKHEMRLAQVRIESQKELLQVQATIIGQKERLIEKLTDSIAAALSSSQPNLVNVTISPVITSSMNVQVGVSNSLGDICKDLKELSYAITNSPEIATEIEAIRQEVERVQTAGYDPAKGSPAINKLEQFLQKISNTGSMIGKTIEKAERGIALAQRLAAHYNELAQWLGLSQIPKLFL